MKSVPALASSSCDSLHAVVIAGGSGTRFWPLSRRACPKQLLNLSGAGPLLQETFARLNECVPPERWWMVVGAGHADACRTVVPAVPDEQVLVEPVARNTAPAIALAALHLQAHDPNAVMVVLPADHHVSDAEAFCNALGTAGALAQEGPIVTLGIRATRPETGYGYIQRGSADTRGEGAYSVQRFTEKPNRAQAEAFLQQGGYDWNAGIFVMRPDVYLREVTRQLPALAAELERIRATLGTSSYARTLASAFDAIQAISIDYGVMEGAAEVSVVPVDCGWSDVGSWNALGAVVSADQDGNVVRGRAVLRDVRDAVVYATPGHMVGVVGVDGVAVVHTPDATLVIPAERAQEVREVLREVETRGWHEHL